LFVRQPWRVMLGTGSFPAIIFLLSLLLVPESPRWLSLKGYHRRAAIILTKIGNSGDAENIPGDTSDLQTKPPMQVGDLVKPVYRKVLLIGLALPFFSQVCGINAIIYYGPRILEQAGFTLSNALGGQVTIGMVNVVFTFVAIFTVDRWGRRPLLLAGIGGVILSLIAIGMLFALKVTSGMWILIFILAFIACFAFSFGPVCWVVVSEIFPNAIRARAMALATLSMWIANFMVGQLTPLMLENVGPACTFWLFAIFCSPALWITWKLIPETKGRSLEMIEKFWNTSNNTQ
jgi:SP family arabinose:H+ symporter-like MFS transporter